MSFACKSVPPGDTEKYAQSGRIKKTVNGIVAQQILDKDLFSQLLIDVAYRMSVNQTSD
jgi:hypothetical protein